ncbi:uncharacterized protein LOC135931227 [Gordionus sp. m RMFG-2023]|uniref:uncharacterized protein LOC135931227 n=1 Tax=Gordionus sp. m RMFG-2023 TaxID=3053472 RepID=UPI0031FD747D
MEIKTTPKIPKNSSQYSTNWKCLLKKIEKNRNPRTIRKKFKSNNQHFLDKKVLNTDSHLLNTKYIAIDCEFVGTGYNGQENHLARVSIVNKNGQCIYDTFVKPREKITDFRYDITGMTYKDMNEGKSFKVVQKDVADILKDKILVGHALKNDLKVLYLTHPRSKIRDTSKHKFFCQAVKTKYPSLKKLAKIFLDTNIQNGIHNPIEDAKTAMMLFLSRKKEWEKELRNKRFKNNIKS